VPSPEEAQEGPEGIAAAARGQSPIGCKACRGHESLRPLLADGRRAGVHGDVPLRRVHRRRPWRGTPAVVGGDVVGNHSGVAGGVATAVSTFVVVLAATTVVVAVVLPMPVVVAVVTVAEAADVVLARRVRRRQRRRQWSGQRFVGVERRRSSS
jgi:Flp pilus assembly protein TadB